MKKRKVVSIVTGVTATVASLGGCVFDCCTNDNVTVYGPPPAEYTSTADYNPDDNENVNVYGPPPADTCETEEEEIIISEYKPSENIMPAVYGPPEYFS